MALRYVDGLPPQTIRLPVPYPVIIDEESAEHLPASNESHLDRRLVEACFACDLRDRLTVGMVPPYDIGMGERHVGNSHADRRLNPRDPLVLDQFFFGRGDLLLAAVDVVGGD